MIWVELWPFDLGVSDRRMLLSRGGEMCYLNKLLLVSVLGWLFQVRNKSSNRNYSLTFLGLGHWGSSFHRKPPPPTHTPLPRYLLLLLFLRDDAELVSLPPERCHLSGVSWVCPRVSSLMWCLKPLLLSPLPGVDLLWVNSYFGLVFSNFVLLVLLLHFVLITFLLLLN